MWMPRAELPILRARAELYRQVRHFFAEREVLEVETPVLSAGATVDPNIDSFCADGLWLQTSPEFPMKRLLAAGSGAIYQIARVFRRDEAGRFHNPEFSLLEWYRPGFDHRMLIDEVEALLWALGIASGARYERLSYRDAFLRHAGLDPFTASETALHAAVQALPGGAPECDAVDAITRRDFYLDLLMSGCVGPALGQDTPLFLYDFPASQAALARIRHDVPPVAERFELFWRGIELANGFHELSDADEQQRRFEIDSRRRAEAGRAVPPYDRQLINALAHGLPDCAGVALGLDRLLMLSLGLEAIGDVLAFDAPRA